MGNRFLNIHSLLYKPACTTTYTCRCKERKSERERDPFYFVFASIAREPNLTWLGTNVALVNSIIDYIRSAVHRWFRIWCWFACVVDKTGKNETEITDFLKFESWNFRSRVSCIYSVFIYRVCNVCFKISRGVHLYNKPHGAKSWFIEISIIFLYVKFSSTSHFRAPTVASEVEYCVATVWVHYKDQARTI